MWGPVKSPASLFFSNSQGQPTESTLQSSRKLCHEVLGNDPALRLWPNRWREMSSSPLSKESQHLGKFTANVERVSRHFRPWPLHQERVSHSVLTSTPGAPTISHVGVEMVISVSTVTSFGTRQDLLNERGIEKQRRPKGELQEAICPWWHGMMGLPRHRRGNHCVTCEKGFVWTYTES